LSNELDFYRLEKILRTGKFWCSQFYELNDPMEAIFRIEAGNDWNVGKIFKDKKKYKICSFAGSEALKDARMWAHYANGFKGVAIEVEIKDENDSGVYKVNYNERIPSGANVLKILTRKNEVWSYEYEYRFLKEDEEEENSFKVGEITAVYYGNPYKNTGNKNNILKDCAKLCEYEKRIQELKDEDKDKKWKDVWMENGIVEWNKENENNNTA